MLAVAHNHRLHHREGHALLAFAGCDFGGAHVVPIAAFPIAFSHVPIGFGQTIDVGDIEPKLFDFGEGRGGRGGACSVGLDDMVKVATVLGGRIDQSV